MCTPESTGSLSLCGAESTHWEGHSKQPLRAASPSGDNGERRLPLHQAVPQGEVDQG